VVLGETMNDLTLLYYTSNQISDYFANNVRNHLLESSKKMLPIISVSHKSINFGDNICVGEIGISSWNIYFQILLGAKEAKTKYVACCEDDSLYTWEHFSYRPKDDEFAYNTNRWNVNKRHYYFRRNRPGMCECIAPTELMIDTLETRMKKYTREACAHIKHLPFYGEPGRYETELGLPVVKRVHFQLETPVLTFNHRPSYGGVRAPLKTDILEEELPYWGSATDLWKDIHG
jgi:hypothetical protein